MSKEEKFPLDFWNQDNITPIAVLGDMLNEIRQANQLIADFSGLLLDADLPSE